MQGMRQLILDEVRSFRKMVRQPASRQGSNGLKGRQESLPIPSREAITETAPADHMSAEDQALHDSPMEEVPRSAIHTPSVLFLHVLQRSFGEGRPMFLR